ncbi:MAG: hypothetical protein AAB380_01715 [Verrucomicrobiota bacterium]
MKTCTLVWEYNYHPAGVKESFASVWMFAGNGRDDLERRQPGWVKVVGPINQKIATEIHTALKHFFVKILLK